QLIKNYPNEPAYFVNQALLNIFEDDYSIAIESINRGLEITKADKQKALLYYFKGLFELLEGNEEEGLRDFEFAILLDKNEFNNPLLQGELQSVEIEALNQLLIRFSLYNKTD
ncbi:MAG: hypothetical protein V1783_11930, partial [Bacteroidota bacterium]